MIASALLASAAAADCAYYRKVSGTTCADDCVPATLGICPRSLIVKEGGLDAGKCSDIGYNKKEGEKDQKAGPCGTLKFETYAKALTSNSTASSCTKDGCFFSYTNPGSEEKGRCGQVDAAPRMPADIWDDQRAVDTYVALTSKYWSGSPTSLLKQQKCPTGWWKGDYQYVKWTGGGSLMYEACSSRCGCRYPHCPDVPDDPKNHHYCSLCGPKFNADIRVDFYYPGSPPGPAPGPGPAPAPSGKTIVDLAQSVPDLSTLVSALKAGKLVDALSGAGPFTVFAPTNEAFAKLPASTLAHLLDPKNIKELDAVLEYHVISGAAIFSKDLKPFQEVKTLEGEELKIVKAGRVIVQNATVTKADNAASNGVVHIIDQVLIPPSAPAPTGCTQDGCLFSYSSIPGLLCGEVDAAPRLPADIWGDQRAVDEYVAATIKLYHVQGMSQGAYLKQEPCDHSWNHTQIGNVTWADQQLMEGTCLSLCGCIYGLNCKDVPDDPKNHRFCSLCGPKFNAPMPVQQYARNL